ncbi:hypothetical protein [Sphaerisporangium corydalis]|uniref:Uncharacterized protein n=1 Tax=Sphaerisporangium corydalis TaxID=1441875 RepID=A0ABV9EPR0_9ACTN|nr:hypothetical protein [Sphaerisporangium corydalis]
MKHDIDRLVSSIAPAPGPGLTPGARELLNEIVSAASPISPTPPAARFRPGAGLRAPLSRWRLLLPLAAVAMLLSWIVPGGIGARPASATLDIRQAGGFYVVTVKDLYADPKRYRAELKSRGLRVSIKLVPTSRSMEGRLIFVVAEYLTATRVKGSRVIPPSDDISALEGTRPCASLTGCPVGVRIRIGYTGPGEIILGRRALPGEAYEAPPSLGAPGEPLHCVGFVNLRVPQVVRLLRDHGVREIGFTTYHGGDPPSVPPSWYVHDGVMSGPDQAFLMVDPAPHPHPRPVDVPGACR